MQNSFSHASGAAHEDREVNGWKLEQPNSLSCSFLVSVDGFWIFGFLMGLGKCFMGFGISVFF